MNDKYFLVTKSHIVKAKNMTHAKALVEGDEDVLSFSDFISDLEQLEMGAE